MITPLVTGIVVTLIGLTLVSVGITSVGGGFEAKHAGTFASAGNLGLAALVIALIVVLSSSKHEWLREFYPWLPAWRLVISSRG